VPLNEAHRFGILTVDETETRRRIPREAEPADADARVLRHGAGRRWASTSSRPKRWSKRSKTTPGRTPARLRQEHHPDDVPALPVYSYRFYDENQKARSTGATSARWTPTTKPNMDLCQVNPEFNLYDPVLAATHLHAAGAAQPSSCSTTTIVAEWRWTLFISSGCIVSGARWWKRACAQRARAQLLHDRDSILMPGVR
jgi:hypothetical protein